MSTTTTNYGLIKPDTTDPILIGQLNDNSDAIDAALKENADAIENKPDAADIPTPSTAAPAMDGTAAAGTSTDYARADHVHPSDTSKQDALTTAQLAAANSGIDSTKVEQIETNKNNISKDEATIAELVEANRRKVYANTENNTSYTFSNLYGLNDSRFKYALVCGGGTANNPALAMAWLIFIDDSGVVTVRKIIGDSTRTLTGSVSGTTLTLTTDSTMYGGLRLIWLS